jgi:hypothetical protein
VDIEMLQLKAHLKIFCSSKHPLSIPKCDTWKANIAHFFHSDIMWYGIDFITITFFSLSFPHYFEIAQDMCVTTRLEEFGLT